MCTLETSGDRLREEGLRGQGVGILPSLRFVLPTPQPSLERTALPTSKYVNTRSDSISEGSAESVAVSTPDKPPDMSTFQNWKGVSPRVSPRLSPSSTQQALQNAHTQSDTLQPGPSSPRSTGRYSPGELGERKTARRASTQLPVGRASPQPELSQERRAMSTGPNRPDYLLGLDRGPLKDLVSDTSPQANRVAFHSGPHTETPPNTTPPMSDTRPQNPPKSMSEGDSTSSRGNLFHSIGAVGRRIIEAPSRKGSTQSARSASSTDSANLAPAQRSASTPDSQPKRYSLGFFNTGSSVSLGKFRRKSDSAVVSGGHGHMRKRSSKEDKEAMVAVQKERLRAYTDKLVKLAGENEKHLAGLLARKDQVTKDAGLLMQRHCDHRTCNMRQINVAMRMVDKAFVTTARYADAVYSYIQKQHVHFLKTAQQELATFVQLDDMEVLWDDVRRNSDACISRANDDVRSVYKTLFGLVHVLEKQQKFILFSSEYSDGGHHTPRVSAVPPPNPPSTSSALPTPSTSTEGSRPSQNSNDAPDRLSVSNQNDDGPHPAQQLRKTSTGSVVTAAGERLEEPYVMRNVPTTVPDPRPKVIYTRFLVDVGEEKEGQTDTPPLGPLPRH